MFFYYYFICTNVYKNTINKIGTNDYWKYI